MANASGSSRTGYWEWTFSGESANHRYTIPGILQALGDLRAARVLDIGCGNGAVTARVAQAGYQATGIDFTETGIERARASFPDIQLRIHDIANPLPQDMRGQFDAVLSCDVIEHLFLPRDLLVRAREALTPNGHVVIATPYHGYWKNLSLAVLNRFDQHWTPKSDYGHIKFFSIRTLRELLDECGFDPIATTKVGRIPPLAPTMIATGRLRPLP